MAILDYTIYNEAMSVLQMLYGPEAAFRPGQYEAIEATMLNHRTLVVQRTGWGKSLVYFTCTKLLRQQDKGVTLVISPLLTLMRNQLSAARQLDLTCDALNSETEDRRAEILASLIAGDLDLVLVTPETLFRPDVQASLPQIRIGLFVIDEAHCISDWGHDFRLEYSRLKEIIRLLPPNVPVLATTATANNRVIEDLCAQLGEQVYVSRGPLSRDSLSIQVLPRQSKTERYAWLLDNLGKIPGSGIIYCLTQRACDDLANFLEAHGIPARAYYSRKKREDEYKNREAEELFQANQIKALVATIKLGMGYDKGDIAFVIHFQMPKNIVAYYQQIGRAGRHIPDAYVYLMNGPEDETILNHFIEKAFPTEEEMTQVYNCICKQNGLGINELAADLNISWGRLDKALMFLVNDGHIMKENSKYYLTALPFVYRQEHYQAITELRQKELEQMIALLHTSDCYSRFIVNALDDPTTTPCGRCANCLGHDVLPSVSLTVSPDAQKKTTDYLHRAPTIPIVPRRQWALSSATVRSKIDHINEEGICLCRYGEAGLGELVRQGKYSAEKRFDDELVKRGAEVLRPLIAQAGITQITCVPSLRSQIVADYAQRLANACNIPFAELLIKHSAEQQKNMQNSAHQCANAFQSFDIMAGAVPEEKVLLVDDIVDSRWTLTVCGYRLMEHGCQKVYPFALADSSQQEEE